MDVEGLRSWFLSHGRKLPWRENRSPYAVWISEVMLQQTQVSVVIPYFKRWMELFPTIEKFAAASEDEVIKAWEGLGYYSRVRHAHQAAKTLNGTLPSTKELLSKIKGLGPYTIGAILSFAFKQKAAAIDGNVLRVMARHEAIDEPIDKMNVQTSIKSKVEALLPPLRPWEIMEALIELGALVCQKKPVCSACPLESSCRSHREGNPEAYPKKKPPVPTTMLHRAVAIVLSQNHVLLRKASKGQVMADLYEFPYVETPDRETLGKSLQMSFSLSLTWKKDLPPCRHSFTRYRATLYPSLWEAELTVVPNFLWIPLGDLTKYPFSSGHRTIMRMIYAHLAH